MDYARRWVLPGAVHPVTIDEIRGVLDEALVMRPPRRKDEPEQGTKEFVSRLEDYLLESAYARANLEEARHYLALTLEHLRTELAEMTGYEALLPRKPQERITEADRNRAKAVARPDLVGAGKDAKLLLESVNRQLQRAEFEAQWVISRAYTMISGG